METLIVLTLLGVMMLIAERVYTYVAATKHRAAVREKMAEEQQMIDKEAEQFLNMLKYTGTRGRVENGEDD